MLTNLLANYEGIRLILNRGLIVANDQFGGMKIRGKDDPSLLSLVDNKEYVCNLCFFQKYFKSSQFLAVTCSQKTHIGIAPIKSWIDESKWKQYFPLSDELSPDEAEEIQHVVMVSS